MTTPPPRFTREAIAAARKVVAEAKRKPRLKPAPLCIVCALRGVHAKGTLCFPCREAFDKFNRRDRTTLGLIRWAAQRAREHAADTRKP